MSFLVYKVTCAVNDKVYIGVTQKTIEHRWRQHVAASKRSWIKRKEKNKDKEVQRVEFS